MSGGSVGREFAWPCRHVLPHFPKWISGYEPHLSVRELRHSCVRKARPPRRGCVRGRGPTASQELMNNGQPYPGVLRMGECVSRLTAARPSSVRGDASRAARGHLAARGGRRELPRQAPTGGHKAEQRLANSRTAHGGPAAGRPGTRLGMALRDGP
ncbi:hypothetical protein SMALA_4915 [Streptomyces malaysiensis subsp. malaysiensis]|nr:hypothetical protein SMALA_4915 [Streptomyces malaysiensis]